MIIRKLEEVKNALLHDAILIAIKLGYKFNRVYVDKEGGCDITFSCKMNVDDAPKTPASFDIQTIPTLMIFKDGQLVDKKVGAMTQSQLTDWVSSHL